MSSADIAGDVGVVVAAVGVLAFLSPAPDRIPPTVRRAVGLSLMTAGWAALLGSLVPGDDWSALGDDLASPKGVVALLVVLALTVGLVWLAVRVLRRWPVAWFVVLALALPFRVPVSLGSQEANLLVPLYAVVGLGIVVWAVGRRSGRIEPGPTTPVDLPLALFVGFLMISTLWSADQSEAAVKVVFFYLPFVVLFRLVVTLWRNTDALRALGLTTVALAVPISMFAVIQYATRSSIFWNDSLQQANVYSRFFRVNSVFFDPNILGRYLVIAMLAAVAMAWVSRDPRALAALAGAVGIMAVGLYVTFSRSSALGLGVGLVLIAWRAFGWRRTTLVGGALLVLLAAAALLGSDNIRRAATSTERLDQVSEGRFDLVEGGLTIWRAEPIAGAGLGGFESRFEDTLSVAEQRRIRVVISHNTPVTVLSETGIIGFALFLLLGVTVTASIARGSRVGGAAGWAQWALLAMLISIFVHSLLYSALFEDPYTWVISGSALAIAAGQRVPVTKRGEAEAPGAALAT